MQQRTSITSRRASGSPQSATSKQGSSYMPAYDLTTVILNQLGKPYESALDPKNSLTLGEVCANALAMPLPNDADGPKKYRKGELSVRLSEHMLNGADKPFTMTVEEASLIKDAVGQGFTSVVVYRVHGLLEQPRIEAKKVN